MCMIHTSLQAANNIRMWQKSHTPSQKSMVRSHKKAIYLISRKIPEVMLISRVPMV
jgi:hypothetical protein